MWEVFTFVIQPYPGLCNEKLGTLSMPVDCPYSVHAMLADITMEATIFLGTA